MKTFIIDNKAPRRTITVIALFSALWIFIGCAGDYGRLVPSEEATSVFHNYQILPDHKYYYSGSDNYPQAIIAIHRKYTLVTELWKPVSPDGEQLKKWLNWRRFRVGYDVFLRGSRIMGPNDELIGYWYANQNRRDWGSVKLESDDRVVIGTPISGRSYSIFGSVTPDEER